MRRLSLLLVAAVLGWVAWALVTLPPESAVLRVPVPAPGDPVVVRGAYHVHSVASDGTGTVEEIAAAAARAGLRFVIVTDHGDAYGRPVAPPRYIGGVLCIDAVEISTAGGHYAALGMAPPPYPLAGEARDVVEDVARLGGFGVAAHPDSEKIGLRWEEWEAPFDAMEWFNADSQWRDEPRWRLLPTVLQYPARPTETVASLFDRPDHLLREWDRFASTRRVVGLAAADAHARMGLGGKTDPYDELVYVKLPSYEAVFRAFSTPVELWKPLTGDAGHDAAAILEALRDGRAYTVFDAMAGPGVLAYSMLAGRVRLLQGQGHWAPAGVPLHVSAATNGPAGTRVRLLRDGREVARSAGPVLEWTGEGAGAYRVEATLPGAPGEPPLPWIVSNPIYSGPPAASGPPVPPPARASLVWPAQTWHVEKDAGSDGSWRTTEQGGVIRHTLDYRLGTGSRSPFVALATFDAGAMHDASRFAFRGAADRPMRLSVQVRLVEGTAERRWQRSVYLSPEPREVTIPLADMREAGTGARRPFDPARIHSLLFVVDSVNTPPGGGGVAWVEGLRTER
jgi:hypothetical protein